MTDALFQPGAQKVYDNFMVWQANGRANPLFITTLGRVGAFSNLVHKKRFS